jgi:hypothetical protein
MAIMNTEIKGPSKIGVGKWRLRLEYDETAFIAQRWASIFAASGLHSDTIPGKVARDVVIQQFTSGIHDAINNWFNGSLGEHGSALLQGIKVYWVTCKIKSEESGTSIPYPEAIEIEFEVIHTLFVAVVITLGIIAALTVGHYAFPEPSRAIFSSAGSLLGSVISAPVKAIAWPLAIVGGVVGLVYYYSKG